ncbi:MAG: hypothetical protein IJH40_02530 [Ruminococcus sp.]|uniref:hypothetical protein n=1 Tax=Ruminococcus sp. TaxID=41978 RepID=UPI0028734402|nr:hypothetical protein [Ruminococcus sp.]MBQ3284496.1 hypothetical protein [Ruminococcus sp.]
MKKLIALLIVILLILSLCFSLSGCDQPTVIVRSELMISDGFSGTRTVTAVYPLSADIDAVKDTLLADSPTDEIDGADFTYVGVEEDGYHFQLLLHFGNKTQYEKIIAALINRSTGVFLSRKNTFLTHGTRMEEDFDVSELIPWVINDTASSDALKNLKFAFDTNTVRIGSDTFDTASTVSINDCTGSPINSISLKTTNDKADTYTRTFAFSIPNDTYTADKDAIEQYFMTNTLPDARYAGWTQEGSNMVYTVIYEQLDLEKMTDVTSALLDTDSVSITYGDVDNASTPLSEGLAFEENLDTFSFIGPDNGYTPLYYSYSLPLNTTYGDGSVFEGGRWVSAGEWKDDLYNVTLDSGSARLRIPDGIQYSVTGIEFSLASLGESRFRRSTDFLYAKSDRSAADYAQSYFAGRNVESEISETDDSLVCRVVFEGTTDEITAQLVHVFGSGNFMAYEQHKGTFDLSVKTEFTDYVNLGYMLNADNAAVPMNYTVSSEGGENIVSVSVDGSETAYTDHSRGTMPMKNGCAEIRYHGNIPVVSSIIIYLASGAVLLLLTAFIAIKLIKPKKKRRYADPLNNPDAVYEAEEEAVEEEAAPADASDTAAANNPLAQTTTFSILELNTLVRNKKYVDEINKDVEERMHAQSIEEQKQDIRAKELEEMSRKVYGPDAEAGEASEESENETPESTDTAEVSDTPAVTDEPLSTEEESDD